MSFSVWVILALLAFIAIWMSLTFTNTLCEGAVGFGLCYKKKSPASSPSPSPSPGR